MRFRHGAAIAAVELKFLAEEFRLLEGAWLDSVYDVETALEKATGREIALKFSKSEGKSFLVCLSPSIIFLSQSKPRQSEAQTAFCSLLRRHLDNARLVSVSQLGSERILELVFSSKSRLIIELFSKGNIIMVDEKGVILGAAEHQAWKDRTIRPGFAYLPPPASAGFGSIASSQFSNLVLSSEKDSVVKALAVDLGLSGVYAEEVCASSGIDHLKKPSSLSEKELQSLFSSLQGLLQRKPEPVALLDDKGNIMEVFPFPVAAAEVPGRQLRHFNSFNDAVAAYSAVHPLLLPGRNFESTGHQRKIRELEIAIGQQEAMINSMSAAVAGNTRAAGLIYEHYMDVRQVLDDYNRLRKSFTPEQLREYFKGNKKVISIDEKTGTITVEFDL